MRGLAYTLVLFPALLACGGGGGGEGPDPVERGRHAYAINCVACHHPDPRLDGSVGPAVAGSPLELVRARVVEGTYPPGYEPRRDSRLMPPQPHLARHVEDLAAYLGSLELAADAE
jgi:mono/diheme cytochrome c family protein